MDHGLWFLHLGHAVGAGPAENLRVLNRAAVEIFRMGHVPVIGVNMALPMIQVAGESAYRDIMMPVSLALTER